MSNTEKINIPILDRIRYQIKHNLILQQTKSIIFKSVINYIHCVLQQLVPLSSTLKRIHKAYLLTT